MTERHGPASVWVVDDDRAVRFVLAQALRDAGYAVQAFDGARAALAALAAGTPPELVFTDVRMPGMDGLAFLDALKAGDPQLPVIVMSAHTDIASTAGAFRGGAHEFLSKPFDLDEAVALAERSLPPSRRRAVPGQAALEPRDDAAAEAPAVDRPESAAALLGQAPAMRTLFRAIGRLAQAPLGVLITGETGTGKELVARALHRESPRASKPFVALNTAAIPAELLESELFGHEAGAFTGATRRHIGRFEQADGGSLFLDEIGDMPAPLQTRLLRVLAEGEFFRVGGRELIRVDVRVLAATHQDLARLVADGRFRADLFHRLDVIRLALPPLRERSTDVPLLASRFLADAARRMGSPVKRLQPEALRRLEQHDWPGNVRELENLCWRLAALAPGESVSARELRTHFEPEPVDASAAGVTSIGATGSGNVGDARWTAALAAAVRAALATDAPAIHARLRERFDQVLLETALEHSGGHRQQAARALGLGRNTLTRKLGVARPRKT
jgi:two-component system nitrogen regulation response regulator GlnG